MSWRAAVRARPGAVVGVLAGALLITCANLVATVLGHPQHLYGAPVPVGSSEVDLFFNGPKLPVTFSPILFGLDVAITAVVLGFATRPFGLSGIAIGTVAAVLSLVAALYMYANGLDNSGVPIPAPRDYRQSVVPASTVYWIDMMLWAFAAGLVRRWLAGRVSSGPRSPTDR